MAQAMGGPSKNRKRRVCGKDSADKGQRRRAARSPLHLAVGYEVAGSLVALRPPHPWPRACHEGVGRLRCSVFRGTPMAFFCVYFKELTCYKKRSIGTTAQCAADIASRRNPQKGIGPRSFLPLLQFSITPTLHSLSHTPSWPFPPV